MKRRAKIAALRFSSSVYSRRVDGVEPKWNTDNAIYGLLARDLGSGPQPEVVVTNVLIPQNDQSECDRALVDSVIQFKVSAQGRTYVFFDFSCFPLRLPELDIMFPFIYECIKGSKAECSILVPLGFTSFIKLSPSIETLDKQLKASFRSISIVDPEGKAYVIGDKTGCTIKDVARRVAGAALPPSHVEFQSAVLRWSDRWFGHYILNSGAHVRTHYDLYNVLLDEWVIKYVIKRIEDLLKENCFDCIVCLGLESRAISYLEYALAARFSLPHTSVCDGSELNLDDLRNSKYPLLLSDVICTGSTADQVAISLRKANMKPVGLFVLLAFINSQDVIEGGIPVWHAAKINRTFYNSRCPLCEMNYPKMKIESVRDFHILPTKANSYDFWEFCVETYALKCSHRVVGEKHYTYYISTISILRLFGDWIAKCLAHRIMEMNSSCCTDALVCIDEPAALDLAERLSVILQIPIYPLNLQSLNTDITPIKELDCIQDSISGQNVIFVDDGVNTLSTYYKIRKLIETVNGKLVGYSVLLSRLSKEKHEYIIKEMGGNFWDFYHWDLPPFNPDNCPECANQMLEET